MSHCSWRERGTPPPQGGETKSRMGSPAGAQAGCSPPLQPTSAQTPQPPPAHVPRPGSPAEPWFWPRGRGPARYGGCRAPSGARRAHGPGGPGALPGMASGGREPSRGWVPGLQARSRSPWAAARWGAPRGARLSCWGTSKRSWHRALSQSPRGSSHHLHGRGAAVEVPVEGQARELALHPQAEPAGGALAGEGGGGVGLPSQQGGHEVGQAVQEGGDVGSQPLVQLLGKGKARCSVGPWRAEPWKSPRSGWWAGCGGPRSHNSPTRHHVPQAGWEPRQPCFDLLLESGKLPPIQPTSETSVQGTHNSPAVLQGGGCWAGQGGSAGGQPHRACPGCVHLRPAGHEGRCGSEQFVLSCQLA